MIADSNKYLIDKKTGNSSLIKGSPILSLDYFAAENEWKYSFDPTELNEIEKSILFALCNLLKKNSPIRTKSREISIREIENFLRVENDKEAFKITEKENNFVKNCLNRWAQRGFFLFLRENLSEPSKKWPEKYLSRVKLLHEIFSENINPLLEKEGLTLDLIALEGSTAIIKVAHEREFIFLSALKLFLEEKIEKVFLNIVAEEESPS